MTQKENGKYKNKPRGQSLIEFALTLPILLLLVIGAMDFGRMFYIKVVTTNAAREGVNYLAYFPDDAQNGYAETLEAIINEAESSNVEVVASEVTFTNCCTPGQAVGVTITKTTDLIFGSFLQSLGLINGPLQLTSTARMVVQ